MTRAVAILGASNTGKSTLVDQLCALEGKPPVAAGPGELRVATLTHLGEAWQAIDTPGSIEFLSVAADALLAADAAVICVSPDPDAAVLAAPYLRLVERSGTPALVFVNRMDEAVGRLRDVVAALQDYTPRPIVLRQVPIRRDGHVVGAVDLVSERAWAYREGEPSRLIEIPKEVTEREREARGDLLEHLSSFDDHLLEELIEDQTPPSAEVYAICAQVLGARTAMPALIGSAAHGNGITRLMKALRHEAPGPAALRDRLREQAGLDVAPSAVVFSGAHRKHLGPALLLRALEPLAANAPLGGRTQGQLGSADPRDGRHLDAAAEGEIVSMVKADHLTPGLLVTEAGTFPAPAWRRAPRPQSQRILEPLTEREGVKLSGALATLAETDGALRVGQDPVTGAALIGIQGPLHLRVLRQRLKETFGLEARDSVPPPAYRETITRSRDQAYRHKKQTGGAGQFADVKLTVAPGARGAGFVFSEVVTGGAVPRNYIPAVEQGTRDAMERGPLGFPVVDVAVVLTDGLHHAVDSSEMAFRIAGRRAVGEALREAAPVLLQPVFKVAIHAPAAFTGAISPIVSAHLGQVLGFDADPDAKGWEVFAALIPGAALADLANDSRAATQGVGSFEAAFDHYEELHGKAAERIVQDHAREPA